MKNLKHLVLNAQLCLLAALAPMNSSYAQVIAPEQATFKSLEATDMVDLITGDMSWNMPILHVPSPEGGFSMNLFYDGGVGMMQESSWVGLGWNMNPGVINRSISGVADDVKNSKLGIYAYDPGGEYSAKSLRIGINFILQLGYTATWGGWNGERHYSGKIDYGMTLGVSAYGVPVLSAGASFDYNTHTYESNTYLTISVGAHSVTYVNGDYWLYSNSALGVTMTTDGNNTYYSLMGASYDSKITSPGSGIFTSEENTTIPLGILQYSSTNFQWWVDYEREINMYGTLYSDEGFEPGNHLTRRQISFWAQDPDRQMDIHEMSAVKNNMSNLTQRYSSASFTIPAYDKYSVYSHGLSGGMQVSLLKPSILCGHREVIENIHSNDRTPNSFIENWYNTNFFKNVNTNSFSISYPQPDLHQFRFLGSNSSYYRFLPPHFVKTISPQSNNLEKNQIHYGNANQITGYEGNSTFNPTLGKLGFGKHIEYFLNNSITSGTAYARGFMECEEMLNTRNSDLSSPSNATALNKIKKTNPDGIGGFYIIKEDGMKYHFSLPVYQFESFSSTRKHSDYSKWATTIKTDPVAISWLLTAITGPDFVDNLDNKVGEGDLGYWVKFNYGLWSDGFIDRFPIVGAKKMGIEKYDGNNNISNADEITDETTASRRQVYYLNSISTRTHTALFVKDIRYDFFSSNSFNISGSYHQSTGISNGMTQTSHDCLNLFGIRQPGLLLKEIILLENKDLNTFSFTNTTGNNSLTSALPAFGRSYLIDRNNVYQLEYDKRFGFNYQNSVLDVSDISNVQNQLNSKSIKKIVFNYDYNLKKSKISGISQIPENPLKGSLTLNSVSLRGKEGVKLIPDYVFSYAKNPIVDTTKMDYWGYMEKQDQDAWSLTGILDPMGYTTNILYESDLIDQVFYDGNMDLPNSSQYPFEGGIRVKRITKSDLSKACSVDYNYRSGFAPCTPYSLQGEIPYAGLQIGPVVLYGEVDVIEKGVNGQFEMSTTFSFDNNYASKLIFEEMADYPGDDELTKYSTRRTVVHNLLSSFGNIKSIVTKNSAGVPISATEYNYINGHLMNYKQGIYQESHVSSKRYYSLIERKDNSSNTLISSFTETVRNSFSVSSIMEYPNIISSVVKYDYINGRKVVHKNLQFDFLSGSILKSEIEQSNGIRNISKTDLAYKTYSTMGPIISTTGTTDYSRKNMLTQRYKEYEYLNKESSSSLVSAIATTFNSNWNYLSIDANGYLTVGSQGMPPVVRKHETYSLVAPRLTNGMFVSSWAEFMANQANPMWQSQLSTEVYNKHSNPVQFKDVSGIYSAKHIDLVGGKLLASVVNSNLFSFTHTSFEHSPTSNPFVNVLVGNGQIVTGTSLPAHTGKKYLQVATSSNNAFPIFKQRQRVDGNGLTLGTEYTVTAWVNAPLGSNAKLNIRLLGNGGLVNQIVSKGFHDPSNVTVGNWKQLTLKILVPANYTTTNATEDFRIFVTDNTTPVFIDDFRVAPSRAVIEGFVYGESGGELTHKLDQNNFYTRMEYDAEGRVKAVFIETLNGEKKINEYQNNYSRN
jgi:YD repeat-containing protein